VTPTAWAPIRRAPRSQVSDSAGRNYVWECVERATKHSESDGVGVIARVVSRVHATEQILLVVQWRAPFNKFVVEVRRPLGCPQQTRCMAQQGTAACSC